VCRGGLDVVYLRISISVLVSINVANRDAFALLSQPDLDTPRARVAHRHGVIETGFALSGSLACCATPV
jgi:hypothetical protein